MQQTNKSLTVLRLRSVLSLATFATLMTACDGQGALVIAELLPKPTSTGGPVRPAPPPPFTGTASTPAAPIPVPNSQGPAVAIPVPEIAACPGQNVSIDEFFDLLQSDLLRQDAQDRPFTRYVSLLDQFNAGHCSEDLGTARAALAKGLNMLSLSTRVTAPVAVDSDEVIYCIDLRDYDWDRILDVSGTTYSDGWEAVIATTPFAVEYAGDEVELIMAQTQTSIPWLYSSALVQAAMQTPLYYALTGVDASLTLDDITIDDLGIDVIANLAEEELIRAGAAVSEFHPESLLVERHDIEVRVGAFWQSFPLSGPAANAMFTDPLNVGGNSGEDAEVAYTLPNGLIAFMIADEESNLINQASGGRDIPWFSQHFHSGFPAIEDEVLEVVLANRFNFNADDFEAVLDIYPPSEAFALIAADDSQSHLGALNQLDATNGDFDPVFATISQFNGPLDSAAVAGALHIPGELLLPNIALLDPSVQVVAAPGGTISRADFAEVYLASICTMQLFFQNQPVVATCDAAIDALDF